MAPLVRDQLPILKALFKWFTKESVVIDSLVFRLHHQASSFVILIGFVFTVIENYLDSKSILCHNQSAVSKYAHSYCWLHGTSYIRNHLQGQATGCYVDHTKLEQDEDALITSYYLWLPYLLSLLFALAKLPHSLWKRHFENNLIGGMLAGIAGGELHDCSKNQQKNKEDKGDGEDKEKGEKDQEDGDGEGEDNKKDGNKKGGGNQNQGGGKKGGGKGKGKGGDGKKNEMIQPQNLANSFVEFRHKFNDYQKWFCFTETLNIFTLLLSVTITHWILNYKFWYYGSEVLNYLTVYGDYYRRGENLHDPMCELFPTEVSCIIHIGSAAGYPDKSNYLCILSNNLFNQKYFFILWLWWMFLLVISIFGFIYRASRIMVPQIARNRLAKVYHGSIDIPFNSSDCFVLELLVQNLSYNPVIVRQFFEHLEIKNKAGVFRKKKPSQADAEDGYKRNMANGGQRFFFDNVRLADETMRKK